MNKAERIQYDDKYFFKGVVGLKESNLHKKMGHKYDTKIHDRN